MPRVTDTRQRMLVAAARLLRRQGYAATAWRRVVAESSTPWGSQAYHFPDGKEQLTVEAIQLAGENYRRLLEAALAATHPADAVPRWARAAARELRASGWADGCPVATVALETAHSSDRIAAACAGAFSGWHAALTGAIEAHGLPRAEAAPLATTVLAAMEGALLLARATRSTEPLDAVGAELATLLRDRIDRNP